MRFMYQNLVFVIMSLYGKKGNIPSKFQVEILMTKMKEYFNLQKERKSN